MHLLRDVVKCTVREWPLNTQTICSKCPPSAWIPFLTSVTRELVTLGTTAVLCKVTSSLIRKGIQAEGGYFRQLV